MRYVVDNDLRAWCSFLNVKLEGPGELLSGEFARKTRRADLLVRVGPDRLLHTEYMRTIEKDAYARMLDYRALIMRQYPESRLTQYALLLGPGRIRMHDDPENGFSLGLKVISLPTVDPDQFLTRPGLSPLAPLAAGDQTVRKRSVIAALKAIQQFPPERQSGLREAAFNLAPVSLGASIIHAVRKEFDVSWEEVIGFYDQTEIGQRLRKQGDELGTARTLAAVLRGRYGSDPRVPAIANGLARHMADVDAAVEAISESTTLDDLLPYRLPTH